MQPDNQQLDPSVVALAKSIGHAESGGNYNSPIGKAGEVGAYQMTPNFIKNYAPKYGIDPNSVAQDPASQDKLAYSVVKDWGTNGDSSYPHLGKLSPAQIASAWNAGDPNAYLDSGYGKNNNYGSTQNYVNKVQSYYEKENSQSPQTASNSAESTPPTPTSSPWDLFSPQSMWKDFTKNFSTAAPAALLAGASIPLGIAAAGTMGVKGLLNKGLSMGAEGLGVKEIYDVATGGNKSVDPTSQAPDPSLQNSQGLSSAIIQALQATPTGRQQAQDPQYKDAINSMGMYGLSPKIENGNMNFSQSRLDANNLIADLSKTNGKILETEGARVPMQEVINKSVEHMKRATPTFQHQEAETHLRSAASAYGHRVDNQGNIALSDVERMRKEIGPAGGKWDATVSSAKREGMKGLYRGARESITNNTKHKEYYNHAMKKEEHLINAKKVMKKLDGKKAPHHQSWKKDLLKAAGEAAGVYIGKKIGGPAGAVIGFLVSKHVVNSADKRYGASIFETPEMKTALHDLKGKAPEAHKWIADELKKVGVEVQEEKKKQEGLLKLPAPAIRQPMRQGKTESVVVGGKHPPRSFEQAKKRKEGRPEYGGLHKKLAEEALARKQVLGR